MTDRMIAHQIIGLSGPQLVIALLGKYVMLAAYGIWATVVEVPTFVKIGSAYFAAAWAVLVFLFATAAAIGVMRSWHSGRYRLEKVTTAAFILTFLAYSVALVIRAVMFQNEASSAPLALLPLAMVWLPTIRFYDLVWRKANNYRPTKGGM